MEQVCSWCEELPRAVLEYPFGEETAVYKIGGKVFAMAEMDIEPSFVTLKVLPEEGEILRSQHDFVREGYDTNKRHWITVDLIPAVPMTGVRELVQDSYHLVVATLPRAKQAGLGLATQ